MVGERIIFCEGVIEMCFGDVIEFFVCYMGLVERDVVIGFYELVFI